MTGVQTCALPIYIVVVARPQAKDRSYQEIESALMHLAEKHHITGKNNDEKISDQDN